VHELSVMQSILDITLEYAAKYSAKKVTRINLEIGELSGFIADWMHRYFEYVSENTIAEKADLYIEHVPAVIKCRSCGNEFQLTREKVEFNCPECRNGSQFEIISGKEYNLKSIEVE
jgi:hydrogenase nickel incorporation protein HypA/HybF